MGSFSNLLIESPLFSNLTDNQLRRIDAICEERIFSKGEMIFEQDSPETELYIVIEGCVDIYYDFSSGFSANRSLSEQAQKPILSFQRGESFGEVSLVDEGCRTAAARAQSDQTKVLLIWRRKLLSLCNAYPDLGFKVMYNLASDLAKRFRRVDADWRKSMLYGKY